MIKTVKTRVVKELVLDKYDVKNICLILDNYTNGSKVWDEEDQEFIKRFWKLAEEITEGEIND